MMNFIPENETYNIIANIVFVGSTIAFLFYYFRTIIKSDNEPETPEVKLKRINRNYKKLQNHIEKYLMEILSDTDNEHHRQCSIPLDAHAFAVSEILLPHITEIWIETQIFQDQEHKYIMVKEESQDKGYEITHLDTDEIINILNNL